MIVSFLIAGAAFLLCIALLQRSGVTLGLPLAYLICLAILHLPGGVAHLLNPGEIIGSVETEVGLAITARSMLFFSLGLAICDLRIPTRSRLLPLRKDPTFWRFCAVNGLLIGIVTAPLRFIPSSQSLIYASGLLWIAGTILALRFYSSRYGNVKSLLGWIGISLINPFFNLFGAGFIGFGIASLSQVYAFMLVRRRGIIASSAVLILASYLGLGVFVTYFAGRDEIRSAVWGGSTTEDRLNTIGNTFSKITLFDHTDLEHAEMLDTRLNQNFIVGMVALNIQEGRIPSANGSTIVQAFLALIPRFVWPDKPFVGGSGSLVSDFTGIEYAEGTSVGIGNVMEAYVNFGDLGCLGLFGFLGYMLRWLDRRAVLAEQQGNYQYFLTSILPAIALIQPGNSLSELIVSTAAAWIAARLWFLWWTKRQRKALLSPSQVK